MLKVELPPATRLNARRHVAKLSPKRNAMSVCDWRSSCPQWATAPDALARACTSVQNPAIQHGRSGFYQSQFIDRAIPLIGGVRPFPGDLRRPGGTVGVAADERFTAVLHRITKARQRYNAAYNAAYRARPRMEAEVKAARAGRAAYMRK